MCSSSDNPPKPTDIVLSSGLGSASFGILRGTGRAGLLLELIFILETAGEESIDIDRFLPDTPIRIVIDHTGEEVTEAYPTEKFSKNMGAGKMDSLLENEAFVDVLLPNMISIATEIAHKKGEKEIHKGLERMNHKLNHEIDRLTALQEKNKHIRPDEIQTARNEQKHLSHLIQKAHIRLDALQLIRKE